MSTHRHHCPVSDAEHSAAAWLGQAGLYHTRLEAVQNGEQHVQSASSDELIEFARSHVREGHSHAPQEREREREREREQKT